MLAQRRERRGDGVTIRRQHGRNGLTVDSRGFITDPGTLAR